MDKSEDQTMKNSEKQSSWYEFLLSNSLNNEDYDLKIDTLYSDTKDQGLNIFEKQQLYQNRLKLSPDYVYGSDDISSLSSGGEIQDLSEDEKQKIIKLNLKEEESQKTQETLKVTRKREINQNWCKKYHGTSLQILRDYIRKPLLKVLRKIKYRLQFFPVVLLIAKKLKFLKQFGNSYKIAAENQLKKLAKRMKKEENKEASFLNSGYRRTIKSFNMFAEGNVEESIKILFDSNLKNKSYKNDSVKRMLELKINFQFSNQSIELLLMDFCESKKKKKSK